MYPLTETFYIGQDLYCVTEPVIIGGEQSKNWLNKPLWRAEKVTEGGTSKQVIAVSLDLIRA